MVPIVLGYLLVLVGNIWFLVCAFLDEPVQGVLCLCVPFYSLYYLVTNFDVVRRPVFLMAAGWLITFLSAFVFGFSLGLHGVGR
jgi:hypothetical protein